MSTRHYFIKAVAPVPPPPPEDMTELVMATRLDPVTGKTQHRAMSRRQAVHQQAVAKGGQVAHAKGHAHRWTSQQARRAALRRWKGRKVWKRTGLRIGEKAKRRPSVRRAPLRVLYTMKPVQGIWYDPLVGWRRRVTSGKKVLTYCISERTALERLGYIPAKTPRKGFVPDAMTKVVRVWEHGGTPSAQGTDNS